MTWIGITTALVLFEINLSPTGLVHGSNRRREELPEHTSQGVRPGESAFLLARLSAGPCFQQRGRQVSTLALSEILTPLIVNIRTMFVSLSLDHSDVSARQKLQASTTGVHQVELPYTKRLMTENSSQIQLEPGRTSGPFCVSEMGNKGRPAAPRSHGWRFSATNRRLLVVEDAVALPAHREILRLGC